MPTNSYTLHLVGEEPFLSVYLCEQHADCLGYILWNASFGPSTIDDAKYNGIAEGAECDVCTDVTCIVPAHTLTPSPT